MKKIVVSDQHIKNLAEMAGMEEWPELFLDEELMEMVFQQHKAAVSYIKKKYK